MQTRPDSRGRPTVRRTNRYIPVALPALDPACLPRVFSLLARPLPAAQDPASSERPAASAEPPSRSHLLCQHLSWFSSWTHHLMTCLFSPIFPLVATQSNICSSRNLCPLPCSRHLAQSFTRERRRVRVVESGLWISWEDCVAGGCDFSVAALGNLGSSGCVLMVTAMVLV